MDADLDPLLASRLAEELARVQAPTPRPVMPRGGLNRLRPIVVAVAVLLIAAAVGRELAVQRTPGSPAGSARALYFGDPYGSGWIEIDPGTLADRGARPLLDHKLGPNEAVVASADGSTIVVSHYGQLLADHAVYDARTGALRGQFTDQEPMIVDGISADGTQLIGRAGSANHSLTDVKLIVSTVDGHVVRRVPAAEGCCVDAIAYDPSLASIYYVMGPSFFTSDPPGLGPVALVVQSTVSGTAKAVPLPGIQAGRVLGGVTATSSAPATLFFAATVLSPDGTRFAALSLDGSILVVVDTATLQVTRKTLVRQANWRDLFSPLVAYGKESADNDSWNAAFSADGRILYAYHTQSFDQGGAAVYLQTIALERVDIGSGSITAVAPSTRPFTDYISNLVPSSDGQSVYVIQSGRLGVIDRTESPFLRRLDASSLTVLAERAIDPNAYDIREFQTPQGSTVRPSTTPATPSASATDMRAPQSVDVDGYHFAAQLLFDPAYGRQAVDAAHSSFLEGLGLRCTWIRTGPDITGPDISGAEELFGSPTNPSGVAGYGTLIRGTTGGRTGGFPTTSSDSAGEIHVVCGMRDAQGDHGEEIIVRSSAAQGTAVVSSFTVIPWRR